MDTDSMAAPHPAPESMAAPRTITVRRVDWRSALALGTRTGKVLAVVGALILLFLAFWVGRVYQNNQDQSLFNQYNPPNTAAGAGFGGSTTFGGTGAGATSGSGTGATTAPSGGSGTGAAAAGGRVVGSVSAISAGSMTLQSFQGGSQTVTLTPQTAFYQTKTGTVNDLSPGETVSILAATSGSSLQASSITIGPAGLATGGGGRFGGGGFGGTGATLTPVRGTITSVGQGSINVSGTSKAIQVSSSTRISQVVRAQRSQIASGSLVTVTLTSSGGQQVAFTVVERNGGFRGGAFPGNGGNGGSG